jgi:hypothetical protein
MIKDKTTITVERETKDRLSRIKISSRASNLDQVIKNLLKEVKNEKLES